MAELDRSPPSLEEDIELHDKVNVLTPYYWRIPLQLDATITNITLLFRTPPNEFLACVKSCSLRVNNEIIDRCRPSEDQDDPRVACFSVTYLPSCDASIHLFFKKPCIDTTLLRILLEINHSPVPNEVTVFTTEAKIMWKDSVVTTEVSKNEEIELSWPSQYLEDSSADEETFESEIVRKYVDAGRAYNQDDIAVMAALGISSLSLTESFDELCKWKATKIMLLNSAISLHTDQ